MSQVDDQASQQAAVDAAQRDYYAVKRMLRLKKAQDSLLEYTHMTMPDPADPDNPDASAYRPAKVHKAIAAALEECEAGRIKRLILNVPPQHGKEIAHDTPVLTPNGWVSHGELRPGDFVFSPNGSPLQVLAVSPDEGLDEYELEFSNGDKVVAHAHHEWQVHDRRKSGAPLRLLETQDLAYEYWIGTKGVRGGRARWQLPDKAPIRFDRKALPLDPYVLGVWLGDGTTGTSCITNSPEDAAVFQAEFKKAGHPCSKVYVHRDYGTHRSYFGRSGLTPGLRAAGVFDRKHIPEVYLRSSKEQRLELLAGLVDSDGHVETDRTCRCRFVTTNPELKDGVFDLAATLGFNPTVVSVPACVSSSGIEGRHRVFTVAFQPTKDLPTRLSRKAIQSEAIRRRVSIVSVRRVEGQKGRCIQVDSPDGMYLVGKTLIPTHNSELCSRRFTSWAIGKRPDRLVIQATYNGDFAKDFGRDVRSIMRTQAYAQIFPKVEFRRGGSAANRFELVQGGKAAFVGRGESLTGRGGHILLLDDPFKDADEADSPAIRAQAWNWFTKVFMTRRRPDACIIIVMTRWHEDDIVGRLTDPGNPHYNPEEAKTWKIINLPAEAEDNDPLGRERGEPLWKERYDKDFLLAQKRLDPRAYSALYQQRPSPEEGDLIKQDMIKTYLPHELPPIDELTVYATSDHATTKDQRNDPNCITVFGVDRQSTIWVLDNFWEHCETDTMVDAMLDKMKLWDPLIWWAGKDHITKSIGPFLRQRMVEDEVYINIEPLSEVVDKVRKAKSIIARMKMGMVRFPLNASWFEAAKSEMLKFPNGRHDDFVDTLAFLGRGLPRLHGPSRNRATEKGPKVGTLAWVKQAGLKAERLRESEKAVGGM